MYLSCSTLVFAKDEYSDITDVVERIRGMGFGALDLAAMAGWQNVEPSELRRCRHLPLDRQMGQNADRRLDRRGKRCLLVVGDHDDITRESNRSYRGPAR